MRRQRWQEGGKGLVDSYKEISFIASWWGGAGEEGENGIGGHCME